MTRAAFLMALIIDNILVFHFNVSEFNSFMLGLILVCLLLFMALIADFLSPVDPKVTTIGFMPPQTTRFQDREGNLALPPRVYPIRETEELDPITFQPLVAPDYDNPQLLGLFVKGSPYRLLGFIPARRHFFGALDGSPVHLLGTDKFGRDVLSRILHGSRISLMIALTVVFIITVVGTTVGMVSGCSAAASTPGCSALSTWFSVSRNCRVIWRSPPLSR